MPWLHCPHPPLPNGLGFVQIGHGKMTVGSTLRRTMEAGTRMVVSRGRGSEADHGSYHIAPRSDSAELKR